MISPRKLDAIFYANVVGQIYESALNPARWRDVLDALESVYPEVRVTLFAHRDGRPIDGMTLQRNFDASDLKAYVDYYVTNSPWVRHAATLDVGRLVYSDECVSTRELVTTEHYNDFIRPRRIGFHGTGLVLERRPDGMTSLSFSDLHDDPTRRANQKRLLGVIAPHMMRALSLSHTTARQKAASAATEAAFNRWADAAFVLDADGLVVAMNDAAVELLDGGDCISLDRRGALRNFDDKVSRSLESAIRKCLGIRGKLDLNTCEADRNGIVLPRNTSAPSLHAMIWPLGFLDDQPAFGPRGRALVMVFDPERPRRTGVGWLARRFNLRASEEALVAALVNGHTLAEAAEQIGIQLSTARTRLKVIQHKTGCNRQVDLMRLATSRPAIRQD